MDSSEGSRKRLRAFSVVIRAAPRRAGPGFLPGDGRSGLPARLVGPAAEWMGAQIRAIRFDENPVEGDVRGDIAHGVEALVRIGQHACEREMQAEVEVGPGIVPAPGEGVLDPADRPPELSQLPDQFALAVAAMNHYRQVELVRELQVTAEPSLAGSRTVLPVPVTVQPGLAQRDDPWLTGQSDNRDQSPSAASAALLGWMPTAPRYRDMPGPSSRTSALSSGRRADGHDLKHAGLPRPFQDPVPIAPQTRSSRCACVSIISLAPLPHRWGERHARPRETAFTPSSPSGGLHHQGRGGRFRRPHSRFGVAHQLEAVSGHMEPLAAEIVRELRVELADQLGVEWRGQVVHRPGPQASEMVMEIAAASYRSGVAPSPPVSLVATPVATSVSRAL